MKDTTVDFRHVLDGHSTRELVYLGAVTVIMLAVMFAVLLA